MRIQDLESRLAADNHLPLLPEVVVKVRAVVASSRSSASDLADVILSDSSLTSRLLKVANSVFYAQRSSKVTHATQAIVVLGFEKVRNLAMALAAHKVLSKLKNPTGILKEFWLHAISTAVGSQLLADKLNNRIGKVPTEEAFVSGLLHDVGKLILSHIDPRRYEQVLDAVSKGEDYIESERIQFQLDHRDAGAALARKWHLPEVLQTAIEGHHDLGPLMHQMEKTGGERSEVWVENTLTWMNRKYARRKHERRDLNMVAIIGVANLMSKSLYGTDGQEPVPIERVHDTAKGVLSMTRTEVDELVEQLRGLVDEVTESFGISIDTLKRFAQQKLAQSKGKPQGQIDHESLAQQRRLQVMQSLTSLFGGNRSFMDKIALVLSHLREVYGFERAFFAVVRSNQKQIEGKLGQGSQAMRLCSKIKVPLGAGGGLLADTVLSAEGQHHEELRNSTNPKIREDRLAASIGSKNFVSLPILADSEVLGLLIFGNSQKATVVSDHDIEPLMMIAGKVGQEIQKATSQKDS